MNKKPFKTFRIVLLIPLAIALVSNIAIQGLGIYLMYLNTPPSTSLMEIIAELQMRPMLWMALAVALFVLSYIAVFATLRVLLTSLHTLKTGVQELVEGNFDKRIEMGVFVPEEFDVLAAEFNRLAEEFSSAEELCNDYINTFSHEFKTPITSVRGFAKLLQDETLDDAQRKEYLEIIIAESERLAHLSKNVLLLSKLGTQTIATSTEIFQLAEQIRRIVLKQEPVWSRKGIAFEIEFDDFPFCGSPELLEHLFANLLDNAIKFSPDNGTIALALHKNKSQIAFSISDCGCGMDGETKKHIFENFYQGKTAQASRGCGIGLSIAKRVVDQCNGKIWVDTALGVGTTFHIVLPINEA